MKKTLFKKIELDYYLLEKEIISQNEKILNYGIEINMNDDVKSINHVSIFPEKVHKILHVLSKEAITPSGLDCVFEDICYEVTGNEYM